MMEQEEQVVKKDIASVAGAGAGLVVHCVVCTAARPRDGRILNCLHVICLKCLTNSLSAHGAVECLGCKLTTTPPDGVKLVSVLPSSHKYFSPDVDSSNGSGNASSETGAGRAVGRVFCDFCDEASLRPATHECMQCDGGAALCLFDAEAHTKKRKYRDHTVLELASAVASACATSGEGYSAHATNTGTDTSTGSSSSSSSSTIAQADVLCPVHSGACLTSYCRTCMAVACQRCVLNGHKYAECSVEPIGRIASELRVELAKLLPGDGARFLEAPQPKSGPCLQQIDDAIEKTAKEIQEVGAIAQAMSSQITTQFSEVEAHLSQQKEKQLKMAEALRWQWQVPLEEKHKRLESLRTKYTAALHLAAALSSPTSSDVDMLRLAPIVCSHLDGFEDDLADNDKPTVARRAEVVCEDSALAGARANIDELARIVDGQDKEPPRPRLRTLSTIRPGETAPPTGAHGSTPVSMRVKLPQPEATLTTPSGRRWNLPLPNWTDSIRHGELSITVPATMSGGYTVEVSFPTPASVTQDIQLHTGPLENVQVELPIQDELALPLRSLKPSADPRWRPVSRTTSLRMARALYDFTGASAEDLTFSEGDIIADVHQHNIDWATGEHGGRRGEFPVNHIEYL